MINCVVCGSNASLFIGIFLIVHGK